MAIRNITEFIQANKVIPLIQSKIRKNLVGESAVTVHPNFGLGRGSSFKIPGFNALSSGDYTGADITFETPTDSSQEILLNQAKYAAFALERVEIDETEVSGVIDSLTTDAAYQITSGIDAYIFSQISASAQTDAATLGESAGAIGVDSSNAIDYIKHLAAAMRNNNITGDLAAVVPSWLGLELAQQLGTGSAADSYATDGFRAGFVRNLFGLDIFESNNMPVSTTEYDVVVGRKSDFHLVYGTMDADQGQREARFDRYFKMLQVYGAGFSNPNTWYKGVISQA